MTQLRKILFSIADKYAGELFRNPQILLDVSAHERTGNAFGRMEQRLPCRTAANE